MRHGSLFSGIGGFDLAAEWIGWDNRFFCDFDPFCQTILKYHFPNATSYKDIKETDFGPWRGQIDVLSGGFPCQPFSQAGKRKGTADDRHLWPEMLRAIREIRPRWILGENVLGIVNWNAGLVFEQVCADLEAEGYSVQPFVLPAAGVNAPHQRYRTWFVAHADGSAEVRTTGECESPSECQRISKRNKIQQSDKSDSIWRRFSIPDNVGYSYGNVQSTIRKVSDGSEPKAESSGICRNDIQWNTPYSEDKRCKRRTENRRKVYNQDRRAEVFSGIAGPGREWIVADTDINGLQALGDDKSLKGQIHSQEAPERYKYGGLSGYWRSFPSQSPLCGGDDGLSTLLDGISLPKWRRESIKAYGNAIVPQVACRIFQAIDAFEKNG